ncbi:MAG: hypothetical protein ABF379_00390 [Akkermansiaceae bacterium]|jgi:hypothetical protein
MKRLLSIAFLVCSIFATADEAGKKPLSKISRGEDALVGYWAADNDFIYQSMLKEAKKAVEEGEVTKEQLKANALKYSKMMLIHFTDQSTSTMHTVTGEKQGTYEITAKHPGKNEIDITIVSKKFGTEKSTLVVRGDTLIMRAEGGGGSVRFERVSNKDAPERIQHIKELGQKK